MSLTITRLVLKNWRNFREADVALGARTFVLGANASGKSNVLDVFRFLRTLAQREGGGLQEAVRERGGLGRIRSLHARKDPEVRLELTLSEPVAGGELRVWRYGLALRSAGKGEARVQVAEELVACDGVVLLNRPNSDDLQDPERLSQTHLEQLGSNAAFRGLAEQLAACTYLHLVPQLLKAGDAAAVRATAHDPFGQRLLLRMAQTPKRTREARLRRIAKALAQAVPLFSELRFAQDAVTGQWHLEANCTHWRVHGAWQREAQFSDGTLRLIGLLWALLDGQGMLLLEEPELSLNEGIVAQIPLLIERVLAQSGRRAIDRQVVITTHSEVLLHGAAHDSRMWLIAPGANGSVMREPNDDERAAMARGLTPAEVLLPHTRSPSVEQLGLF